MMRLIAGWGFKSSAVQQSFASCWSQARQALQTLSAAELAPVPWAHALLETRAQAPAWAEFAAWAAEQTPGTQLLRCKAIDLQAVATQTVSARVQQRFGCGSVSEALAFVGAETLMHQWVCAPENVADVLPIPPNIQFVLPRIVSADRQATLAVAGLTGFAQAFYSSQTGVIS